MTNEGAIKDIKENILPIVGGKSLLMAIAALEAYVPDTNVGDMISRQAATTIPVMPKEHRHYQTNNLDDAYEQGWNDLQECIENLPTVQTEIIHCKDCKHWNLQVGNVKGDGLGSCDFHNANLVTGEGFCYWAELSERW